MAKAFSACRPRPSLSLPPVDPIPREGLLRERRNAGTGRRNPRRRQDPMTNGFVLATDPMLPPCGLEGAVYAIGNFDGCPQGHKRTAGRHVVWGKKSGA